MTTQENGTAFQAAVAKAHAAQERKDFEASLAAWRAVRREFETAPHGYIGMADVLSKMSRSKEAAEIVALGAARFPDNERLAVEQAWVAHHAGDWLTAESRWSHVRRTFPNALPGYFGGGATLKALGKFDEAETVYSDGLKRWPNAMNILADYAAVAHARGDAAEASKRWANLRERFPEEQISYLREARELRAAQRYADAEAVLLMAIDRLKGNPKPLIEYAQIAQHRGLSAQALTRWEAVVTAFPGMFDGYVGAANALNDLGRFSDAQNVLLPASRMFPDSADVGMLNAWIAHYQADFTTAIDRWSAVRSRFPDQVGAYIGGIASLLAANQADAAQTLTSEAIGLFPDNLYIAMEWARLPQHDNNWEESLARWESVHQRFPNAPAAIIGCAKALSKLERPDDAERLLEAALSQNGAEIAAMRAYADCASQRRDWNAAEQRWRNITDRFPEKSIGWSGLAETLRDAGRLDEADTLLASILERFPDSVDIGRQRALTATLRRDWARALPMWDELKRKHPRNPGVLGSIKNMLWQAQQDLGVAASEGDAPAFQIPPGLLALDGEEDSHEASLAKLFLQFETIGDNCEFGIVQRRFGAEPISLLRWASTRPRDLVTALDTNLDGVGDAEFTVISVVHGEYTSRDSRYHMFSHTFTPETVEPIERFTKQHLRRTQYLRRKLLDDLVNGDKIYVYKCLQGLSDTEAWAIYDALRRYRSKQALLCVRLVEPGHKVGDLDHLGEGLYMGYIDRFSTVNINVDAWVTLCRKTAEAWSGKNLP